MADVNPRTEEWNALPWKDIQRNVFRLQKRIYRAARRVPMTMARILKSGVTGNCYAPFGSGGGVGDRPADHNLGCNYRARSCALYIQLNRKRTPIKSKGPEIPK